MSFPSMCLPTFPNTICSKDYLFSLHWIVLALLSKIGWLRISGLFLDFKILYNLLYLSFISLVYMSWVQSLSRVWLWLREPQHARPPCPSPTPGGHPNPCPSSWWCHPTISSSVVPFSSCPQSFPASGCFQVSQLFASGGQSIRVSASTSALTMNTRDWSPLGWTCWISLQSKGLSRVFSNTIVQKHQFFGAQLSL